ncbi:unnamed protein product [Echinostoma caproni]|uniref:5'-AMP-activated protein kinase subunit gamma-1 n=1 Tax=Echinostoma caproni TaxID=27848 RepID=A0A183AH14_9TREM|nr:unnamed protein product [Echinostoma caproni]
MPVDHQPLQDSKMLHQTILSKSAYCRSGSSACLSSNPITNIHQFFQLIQFINTRYKVSSVSQYCPLTLRLTNENQPLISVSPETTLYDAARTLIKCRFHRLPIIDTEFGNPLYILTHKRILNYLYLNVSFTEYHQNSGRQWLRGGIYWSKPAMTAGQTRCKQTASSAQN